VGGSVGIDEVFVGVALFVIAASSAPPLAECRWLYLWDFAAFLYVGAIRLNFGCVRRRGGEGRKRERQVGR